MRKKSNFNYSLVVKAKDNSLSSSLKIRKANKPKAASSTFEHKNQLIEGHVQAYSLQQATSKILIEVIGVYFDTFRKEQEQEEDLN